MIKEATARRSNMTIEAILPDNLCTGDILVSKTGKMVTVQRTSKRNNDGERLYRLRFANGVLGSGRYTRDEFQQMGCTLVEKILEKSGDPDFTVGMSENKATSEKE